MLPQNFFYLKVSDAFFLYCEAKYDVYQLNQLLLNLRRLSWCYMNAWIINFGNDPR